MKKNIKGILTVLIYIAIVLLDVIHGITSYRGFLNTYGDQSFADGFLGILICNGGHFLIFFAATLVLVIALKNQRKNMK